MDEQQLQNAAAETRKRVQRTRERAKGHLHNAIEIEKTVMAQNAMLAEASPDKRELHERRVQEGREFIAEAERELQVLEDADAEDAYPTS